MRATGLEQERIRLYSELPARLTHYFTPNDQLAYEPKAEKNARKKGTTTLADYLSWLRERGALGAPQELATQTKAWLEERGAKIPELFQPLRCALTGMGGGADLFELADLLGYERVCARIEAGLQRL